MKQSGSFQKFLKTALGSFWNPGRKIPSRSSMGRPIIIVGRGGGVGSFAYLRTCLYQALKARNRRQARTGNPVDVRQSLQQIASYSAFFQIRQPIYLTCNRSCPCTKSITIHTPCAMHHAPCTVCIGGCDYVSPLSRRKPNSPKESRYWIGPVAMLYFIFTFKIHIYNILNT